MKQILKNWLKSDFVRNALCWIAAQYIRLVGITSKFEFHHAHIPQKFWDEDKPFILSFWHGRLLLMPLIWAKGKEIQMLISAHRDGQLIANTVKHHDIDAIIGSKNKKGAEALRTMLRGIKDGACIGITPDGPRGPRMRSSNGIVSLAKLSGVPVIPAVVGATRRKHLKSWDRFMIALPFSKGVFMWGEPIYVDRKADKDEMETQRLKIEESMNALQAEADRLSGHLPIEPADEASS